LIKRRQGGRVVEVRSRVAHGRKKRVNKELGQLGYEKPNLSTIERQNATSRLMNAYLVRRSLASSSHEALGGESTIVYNKYRSHRKERIPAISTEARRCYEQRTPAMAAGLTDFIWTAADVLRTPVYLAGGAR